MNAVEWAENNWIVPETNRLIRLGGWQKAALTAMFPPDGSPSPYETFLLSTVKKGGKTELDALAVMYAILTFPAGETALVVANDEAQARDRVFDRIVKQVRLQGMEQVGEAIVTKSEILFPHTGSRIVAISSDFAGEAGGLFGITSWTELWAFRHEAHIRLWEELTPIPNRRSLRIVDSYAGFSGDSPILEPMWSRAIAGERLDDELPVFANGKLWAYIDQGEEAQARAWLGDPAERAAYYEEQRESLRPGTYARLHENKWQTGEEAFLTAEDWDAITHKYTPASEDPAVHAFVGVDAGTKRDNAAVVAVGWTPRGLELLAHRIWAPPKGGTLDLEATIESYVRELAKRFGSISVTFDPSQMIRSAQELRRHQIPMRELPQTIGNLTQASQALYDTVKERQIRCYKAKDLRQHVLNAVAVESPRGWRLAKEKTSRKIDGAVALSFAVLAATTGYRGPVSTESRARTGLGVDVVALRGQDPRFGSVMPGARVSGGVPGGPDPLPRRGLSPPGSWPGGRIDR